MQNFDFILKKMPPLEKASYMSAYRKLPESFLREHYDNDNIIWDFVSAYSKLSKQFIIDFKDKLNWDLIFSYQNIEIPMIDSIDNRKYWSYTSSRILLEENFILKNKDYVDWDLISRYQNLSSDFIINNIETLNIDSLIRNKNRVVQNIKDEHRVTLTLLGYGQLFEQPFVNKYNYFRK